MSNPNSAPVVLITGASAGIGQALAKKYASQKSRLVLVARRLDRLEELKTNFCNQYGLDQKDILNVQADVSNEEQMRELVQKVDSHFGRVDTVIANAGFGVQGKFEKLEWADYQRQFDVNIKGVYLTIYPFLEMLKASRGRIGIVGSVASYVGLPFGSAYSMSKFAVRAMAEAMDLEIRDKYGVSTTILCPGFVTTELHYVDNHGVYHPDKKPRRPEWLRKYIFMAPDRAAAIMVRAVERRKQEQIITFHGFLAIWFSRLMPGIMKFLMRKVIKSK